MLDCKAPEWMLEHNKHRCGFTGPNIIVIMLAVIVILCTQWERVVLKGEPLCVPLCEPLFADSSRLEETNLGQYVIELGCWQLWTSHRSMTVIGLSTIFLYFLPSMKFANNVCISFLEYYYHDYRFYCDQTEFVHCKGNSAVRKTFTFLNISNRLIALRKLSLSSKF